MNVDKVCNWSLKSRFSKKDMTPQFGQVAETLQRRLGVRQDCRILEARGALKLTTITDSENFAQLDEHNKDSIVTKRYHESASSHIFLNKIVNKATLDQIAKGYSITHDSGLANFDDSTPVDSNDMNQQSMIWQVKDRTRNHNDYAYNLTTRDYVLVMELITNNRKGVF
ncbi:hypothetical protein RFI_38416 [Reticulomyxa filosa]|uniref:Uncharacterized protein n=1 Tax=Reticulomyxa filosa TaxID=46433 RepID=X6LD66_RETFI|nr:hypothetical protein RFI_38416 [Reticulomyxa filosa]|eukprot:ETN99071.1 hypothetical protein RFI_38416 [Reticulomyxa filosa]